MTTLSHLINWKEVEDYIYMLTGSTDSPMAWRWIYESVKKGGASLGGTLEQMKERLCKAQDTGYGIFTMINEMPLPAYDGYIKQKGSFVTQLRAIVVDGDDIPLPTTWPITPNFLVIRNETRWHAYFLLDDTCRDIVNVSTWKSLQLQMALYFNGDTSLTDVGRVIRVPGTWHLKDPSNPCLMRLEINDIVSRYTYDQLQRMHPVESIKNQVVVLYDDRTRDVTIPLDTPSSMLAASNYLESVSPEVDESVWNHHIYKTAAMLRDIGMSSEIGYSMICKWVGPQDQYPENDAKILEIVTNVYSYAQQPAGIKSVEHIQINEDDVKRYNRDITPSDAWLNMLEVDRNGRFCKTYHNLSLYLKYCPAVKDKFKKNLFTQEEEIHGTVPFFEFFDDLDVNPISDDFYHSLRGWLASSHRFEPPLRDIISAVTLLCNGNQYHPVRDYIKSLTWDGVPRIRKFFSTYSNAESSEYVDHVGEMTLIACVARVMKPGCKYDYMLIFETYDQGKGKGKMLDILGGSWYKSFTIDFRNKDMIQNCHTGWILECPELVGNSQASSLELKNFITDRIDHFRKPYGRKPAVYRRQFILFGSTNELEYLRDETGARRYLIIKSKITNDEKLRQDRDQIWAEAYVKFQEGYQLYLPDHLLAEAKRVTDERFVFDGLHEVITEYTSREIETKGQVTVRDIWSNCLCGMEKDLTPPMTSRIGKVLRKMGLTSIVKYVDGSTKRVWVSRTE